MFYSFNRYDHEEDIKIKRCENCLEIIHIGDDYFSGPIDICPNCFDELTEEEKEEYTEKTFWD